MGLAEMDANGRIGGEPIEEEEDELPFSDEELMAIESEEEEVEDMNTGGLVGFVEGGLNLPPETQVTDYTSEAFQLNPQDPTQVMTGGTSTGYELVTYYGPNGETVNIPFFNGMALGVIPAGYTRNAPQETAVEQVTKESNDTPAVTPTEPEETYRSKKSVEDLTNTDLRLQKAMLMGVSTLMPLAKVATAPQLKKLNEEIDKRKEAGLYSRDYDALFDQEGLEGMFESDFSSPEKFRAALDYVAPEGMRWDDQDQTYKRSDDAEPVGVQLGGTKIDTTDSGVDVYTGGPRPKLRPDSVSEPREGTGASDTKGFYESITGKKFKDTALGKALGLDDDEDEA
jgi:hypothetical protein